MKAKKRLKQLSEKLKKVGVSVNYLKDAFSNALDKSITERNIEMIDKEHIKIIIANTLNKDDKKNNDR